MIQELMTNIKTLPPINSTINFGNSLYNEIYDVVKSTIPSFLILTVADVASNKLNHQSYTLSIGTHLIKTKIALQFLTTAFLYISNVQNTEELASCSEQPIYSFCCVSNAVLENLGIATMTFYTWGALGAADSKSNLMLYSVKHGIELGAIGLPIGLAISNYEPSLGDIGIWTARFITRFMIIESIKNHFALKNDNIKGIITNTALSLIVGGFAQSIFHFDILKSDLPSLLQYEGVVGGINAGLYQIAGVLFENEALSYASAITIETLDGILRNLLDQTALDQQNNSIASDAIYEPDIAQNDGANNVYYGTHGNQTMILSYLAGKYDFCDL